MELPPENASCQLQNTRHGDGGRAYELLHPGVIVRRHCVPSAASSESGPGDVERDVKDGGRRRITIGIPGVEYKLHAFPSPKEWYPHPYPAASIGSALIPLRQLTRPKRVCNLFGRLYDYNVPRSDAVPALPTGYRRPRTSFRIDVLRQMPKVQLYSPTVPLGASTTTPNERVSIELVYLPARPAICKEG